MTIKGRIVYENVVVQHCAKLCIAVSGTAGPVNSESCPPDSDAGEQNATAARKPGCAASVIFPRHFRYRE
jgi:hypothetical protein